MQASSSSSSSSSSSESSEGSKLPVFGLLHQQPEVADGHRNEEKGPEKTADRWWWIYIQSHTGEGEQLANKKFFFFFLKKKFKVSIFFFKKQNGGWWNADIFSSAKKMTKWLKIRKLYLAWPDPIEHEKKRKITGNFFNDFQHFFSCYTKEIL